MKRKKGESHVKYGTELHPNSSVRTILLCQTRSAEKPNSWLRLESYLQSLADMCVAHARAFLWEWPVMQCNSVSILYS